MDNENLTTQIDGGAVQDGDDPNLETQQDLLEEDVQDTTPEQEGKSAEQLRKERATAINEAVKNHKEAETARADKELYETLYTVARDPESIVKIHETNPELADQVAKKHWGMSYNQLLREAQGDKAQTLSEDDIDALLEKKIQAREQKQSKQKIDSVVTDFFLDNDIDPKSPDFKDIMSDFKELSPKTPQQAERVLRMLYNEHTGRTAAPISIGASVPRTTSAGSTRVKKTGYDEALKYGASFGLTEADFKKYLGKKK